MKTIYPVFLRKFGGWLLGGILLGSLAGPLLAAPGAAPGAENKSLTPPPTTAVEAPSSGKAAQAQAQAESHLKELTNLRAHLAADLGIKLVAIPAGDFLMGSPTDEAGRVTNEGPQRRVTLTKDYLLGATEVTQAQYAAIMGVNPSRFTAAGLNAPVETVGQEDARKFCDKLTERMQAAGYLPAGYGFALPTEAQWEYAARAMTTGPNAGDLAAMAWYKDNSAQTTHPVGLKQSNPWGLYDIYGNVAEWCIDGPQTYASAPSTDPVGPFPNVVNSLVALNARAQGLTAVQHLVRGGYWSAIADYCRPAYRKFIPGFKGSFIGFRVALVPLPILPARPTTPPVVASAGTGK